MNLDDLQTTYPEFVFEKTEVDFGADLELRFYFSCGEQSFVSKYILENAKVADENKEAIKRLAFHIGMAEIPSYWKAFCSPKIVIKAGKLDSEQTKFWQKLFFFGMGEFFFMNHFKPFQTEIVSQSHEDTSVKFNGSLDESSVLVPVGGGKDSVVSLELISKHDFKISTYSGHVGASENVIQTYAELHKLEKDYVGKRILDPHLFELNRTGHPNGHTPFSSVLAFETLLVGYLAGSKYIVLSNEGSANEPTAQYEGIPVNHQYSKTFEFEKDFKNYVEHSMAGVPEYFSFMRPLYELQIVKLFSNYKEYFRQFKSCNRGQKTNAWCGECPKCVFVALLLSAFVDDDVIFKIWGKNPLNAEKNIPIMEELLGFTPYKPFECVGTVLESGAAAYLGWKKREGKNQPLVFTHYEKWIRENESMLRENSEMILKQFSNEHELPSQFLTILKRSLSS